MKFIIRYNSKRIIFGLWRLRYKSHSSRNYFWWLNTFSFVSSYFLCWNIYTIGFLVLVTLVHPPEDSSLESLESTKQTTSGVSFSYFRFLLMSFLSSKVSPILNLNKRFYLYIKSGYLGYLFPMLFRALERHMSSKDTVILE